VPDTFCHRLRLQTLNEVPWKMWMGSALPERRAYQVDNGDHPEMYEIYRLAAGMPIPNGDF